jgi:hypothetical protein
VHPSEEAKVGERGRAQSSQNRFQVDHARIVRRGLRVRLSASVLSYADLRSVEPVLLCGVSASARVGRTNDSVADRPRCRNE